jgi:hypothetical protein
MNSNQTVENQTVVCATVETQTVDCPICFDDIDANKNCVITECGHKFHASCLLRSIAHSNFDCPCCRFELTERPEESDDEYDDDDEEEDDDEISNETMQSMRWLFQRAEGEELEEEEEEEDEDEDQVPEVPLNYVVDNLQTMNYTFEDMIKIILNDFLDNEQDERSATILEAVDSLIDRYEGTAETTAPAVDTPVVVAPAPNTDDEEVTDDIKTFIPKINFNVVKRYQATSWLCGNN